MSAAIRTEKLTKYYGKERGVVDLDLEIAEGEVFGYLGPNGAGKTTTIRLFLDLLRPTTGSIEVLGESPRSVETRRTIGYLPGELALYEHMTVKNLLTYLANLRGLRGLGGAGEFAERLELDMTRKIGDLSSGNKQKVGLVQAFMHRPSLLILDEPTGGLDPLMQQEFYRMIREARREGRTVFLSSHTLSEVERIADRVGIIRDGNLVVVESLDSLKARAPRRIELHFASPVPPEHFRALENVENVVVDDGIVSCRVVGSVDRLIKAAAEFEVTNIISHEADLEELFLGYFRGDGDAA
ncbi:putative ABC transporter ATP-binding protein YxlF [bacterium BMS3Abin02]|nr:putative ABC transporter ATP-binding protein YxlF [bacterium BMS3Abin02]GBE21579.1 putative ABC transporter ATP-binding protein YxlF [bacterium BMS3Bbin01]HDH26247.1 ABC transporter ATP-binding protein [Actinomycetota bacterium]HDL49491.1 ABC transporter ATP-binding protein [Actinomycetota bacterium]